MILQLAKAKMWPRRGVKSLSPIQRAFSHPDESLFTRRPSPTAKISQHQVSYFSSSNRQPWFPLSRLYPASCALAPHYVPHSLRAPIYSSSLSHFFATPSSLLHRAAFASPSDSRSSPSKNSKSSSSTSSSSSASSNPAEELYHSLDSLPPSEAKEKAARGFVRGSYDVSNFPPDRIRNFCIIAHVDHGKSTLADRMIEMCGALPPGAQSQFLDKLQVERERGITVKAQTVSLVHHHTDGRTYLINLIDTPGHVDFSYEVSRSLAACQGALLVVDAAQGIQAQTVANFYLAFEQGLDLVPVLNKVDLPTADPDARAEELETAFDMPPEQTLRASAKTGRGLPAVLSAIVDRIRAPVGDASAPLRMLLFDAHHDPHRGVVCLVAVREGRVRKGDLIHTAGTDQIYEVQELGLLAPNQHAVPQLMAGQVGYMISNMKDIKAARVGDTLFRKGFPVPPLPGFRPAKSMVFAGLYPFSGDELERLGAAMERLTLNDASVSCRREISEALGPGFRCGFLGMLHMEVFLQRLEQEFGASVVSTAPTVPYRVTMADGRQWQLERASDFPLDERVKSIEEPTVIATIIMPDTYLGRVIDLLASRRGEQLEQLTLAAASAKSPTGSATDGASNGRREGSGGESAKTEENGTNASGGAGEGADSTSFKVAGAASGSGGLSGDPNGGRTLLRYVLPLSELGGDFYSDLKARTQGYASFDYEEGPLREADLQRLDVIAQGKVVDALSRLAPKQRIQVTGRALLAKLVALLNRQQFEVVLQAAADGRVFARESLKALRKDVTAKCYGGDVSRKRKLLDRQKEGKKRLKRLGSIDVPQEVFPELMKTR